MTVEFSEPAWEQLVYWVRQDRSMVYKIDKLVTSIRRTPFDGLGKPEALRHDLQGFWTRRITQEHRLVYEIYTGSDGAQRCLIVACRFHYGG